jgi:hypothetical protein
MAWILVPCLVSLRGEFNALAPARDRSSDGSIGDAAHAGSSSDHNPDETGATPSEDADSTNEVHAIDVDVDLHKPGWSMAKAVEVLVRRHRSGDDDRLQNVIYNRRIWSRSWGWTAREYTGSNPHDHHAHFSSRYTTAQERDTRSWGLLDAAELEDDMPTPAEYAQAVASKISTDLHDPSSGIYQGAQALILDFVRTVPVELVGGPNTRTQALGWSPQALAGYIGYLFEAVNAQPKMDDPAHPSGPQVSGALVSRLARIESAVTEPTSPPSEDPTPPADDPITPTGR